MPRRYTDPLHFSITLRMRMMNSNGLNRLSFPVPRNPAPCTMGRDVGTISAASRRHRISSVSWRARSSPRRERNTIWLAWELPSSSSMALPAMSGSTASTGTSRTFILFTFNAPLSTRLSPVKSSAPRRWRTLPRSQHAAPFFPGTPNGSPRRQAGRPPRGKARLQGRSGC